MIKFLSLFSLGNVDDFLSQMFSLARLLITRSIWRKEGAFRRSCRALSFSRFHSLETPFALTKLLEVLNSFSLFILLNFLADLRYFTFWLICDCHWTLKCWIIIEGIILDNWLFRWPNLSFMFLYWTSSWLCRTRTFTRFVSCRKQCTLPSSSRDCLNLLFVFF